MSKDYYDLHKKYTETECDNIKLRMTHCNVQQCPDRQPPTGF